MKDTLKTVGSAVLSVLKTIGVAMYAIIDTLWSSTIGLLIANIIWIASALSLMGIMSETEPYKDYSVAKRLFAAYMTNRAFTWRNVSELYRKSLKTFDIKDSLDED